MRYPIRVFSDLHLGHPASTIQTVEQLKPLLEGAGTVIFNGDTFQMLATEYRNHAEQLFNQLKELCFQVNVDAIFLPGNHDPNISQQTHVELLEEKIVIFHGDVIYPTVSPWSKFYFKKKTQIDDYLNSLDINSLSLSERFQLAHKVVRLMTPERCEKRKCSRISYYLDMLYPPRRLWELATIKHTHKKELTEFTHQHFPKAEVIIYGHFHLINQFQLKQKTFVSTGAFMCGGQPAVIELTEDKEVRLKEVDRKDSAFHYSMNKIHLLREF